MSRLSAGLLALVCLIAGALAATLWLQSSPTLTRDDVRQIAADVVSEQAPMQTGDIDASKLHPMIESYLLSNPTLLERMSVALRDQKNAEAADKAKTAIADMKDEIFDAPNQIVVGNPDGDVTLVELFDYNCPYCKAEMPDLATLLAEDDQLRVVFKEFPILSQDSVDVARIAVAYSTTEGDYWKLHEALFSQSGHIDKQVALDTAKQLGANPVSLELDAQSQKVTDIIQNSFDIAQALNVTGTPTFIIGDEVIPGAIGIDTLREKIANMRKCGKTVCEG